MHARTDMRERTGAFFECTREIGPATGIRFGNLSHPSLTPDSQMFAGGTMVGIRYYPFVHNAASRNYPAAPSARPHRRRKFWDFTSGVCASASFLLPVIQRTAVWSSQKTHRGNCNLRFASREWDRKLHRIRDMHDDERINLIPRILAFD